MRTLHTLALSIILAAVANYAAQAQDLTPRAYVITPLHANAVTLSYGFYSGEVDFNGVVPFTDATGTYSIPILSYYHSLRFFSRSANVVAALPYGVGNFKAINQGQQQQIYRSGLLDSVFRASVNLVGGPAMEPREFLKWKQKTLLGVSLKVIAPTGQYDPHKLVNWGINRWAFQPELGYSRRFGHWLVDGYAGVRFFTTNPQSFSVPAPKAQTQSPVGSFEGHLSYDFKPFLWASLDGNFWFGGTTTLGGVTNTATRQQSSRIGGTFSMPIAKHQSVKVSFSDGAVVRYGGDYRNVSVAWQYSWLGKPK